MTKPFFQSAHTGARANRGWPFDRGFSLVELLVAVGTLAILLALLFPVLSGTLARSKEGRCLANLRSLHQGAVMYAGENHGRVPHTDTSEAIYWFRQIGPYVDSEDVLTDVFRCPAHVPPQPRGAGRLKLGWQNLDYAYMQVRGTGAALGEIRLQAVPAPAKSAFLVDGSRASEVGIFSGGTFRDAVGARIGDRKKFNAVFWDGHVETLPLPDSSAGWNSLFDQLTGK